ncbi:hypothetical protein TNCV_5064941 [Trichonephila clavipes]|nr:hypothetical protein TNCV_5064941 [Trichonephila clavipes]
MDAKLVDIHFIYDQANGNGDVCCSDVRRKDVQRGGDRIIKRSLGCIETLWNVNLSETGLTTRSSILKLT